MKIDHPHIYSTFKRSINSSALRWRRKRLYKLPRLGHPLFLGFLVIIILIITTIMFMFIMCSLCSVYVLDF
ncbi:hypothetical protein RchiOBHm_Chr7g0177691 [Rosa chinensis]|uniref:Uncharacterized protein n=1 Tax=Rosa chinensis TaxID=74649 RepID=A0A2P6P1N1_ROSCH|nr:hypothetical protein RchiOBHm_Chr7g0177691 [Rosa chinensis]